jgi:hypothetical protein
MQQDRAAIFAVVVVYSDLVKVADLKTLTLIPYTTSVLRLTAFHSHWCSYSVVEQSD